jgi:signal transduction histidine kinase
VKPLGRDTLLLSAFLIVGLLIAYQLGVTILQPSWKGPATDWLRAFLAWPGLLAVILTSFWLTRTRQPESLAWWMLSAGFLAYAIAQTLWGIFNQVVSPNRTPVPSWPDLFYLLQYPCFFLALTLLPRTLPWGQSALARVKVVLDCLLVMAAAAAFSWAFLMAPLYGKSAQSLLGRITNLAYPIGDLGVLFGLVLMIAYRRPVERSVLILLIGAITFLAFADSWYLTSNLHASFLSGEVPDLFWMGCYLLFPLAGLAQLRLAQRKVVAQKEGKSPAHLNAPPREGAFIGSVRFLFPFMAALLAGGVLVVQATVEPSSPNSPYIAFAVTFCVLLLVIMRQELTFLEGERWRREREVAQVNELAALQEANRQMDTFLGMASHELKTPLASMKLGLQLQARRFQRQVQRDTEALTEFEPIIEGFVRVEHQEQRLERLVDDLLDVSRIQAGKLELRSEWADLVTIAREAVEEQRQAAPTRTLLLQLPAEQPVPVDADADRIGQVVTNYVTNALKYSPDDRPVEAGINVEGQQACVWVRDEGPGLPPEEHERVWQRFHRVKGIEIQSGTGIGLGLGLYLCHAIIEQHQGRVGVQSAPGQGSTFWFTLPLASQQNKQRAG